MYSMLLKCASIINLILIRLYWIISHVLIVSLVSCVKSGGQRTDSPVLWM